MPAKLTVQQIRQRFDDDVERFSNLETGQSATIDAPLVLDLITRAAAAVNPSAERVLDVGCGAGNYTLKLLELLPGLDVDLIDLSQPMLNRAVERISEANARQITPLQGDIRELPLGRHRYDIIMAAAVLHHLREEAEWQLVFSKLHEALKPGGSLWISDLVTHSTPRVHEMMWTRYGDYLTRLRDESYRNEVFSYIEQEDTPRPLLYQIDLLCEVGFRQIEVLHKNSNFAAFGAVK